MKHNHSICPHCGCGCGLYIVEQDGLVSGTTASQKHYFSQGQLCARGWTSHQLLRSSKRLKLQVGQPGKAAARDWPQALKQTAERLKAIREKHGPASIGIIGSPRLPQEDAWALRSLAEDVLGTPHFDSGARMEWIPEILPQPGKYRDIELADLIIIFGADLLEENPILGARVMSRSKPKEDRPYVSPDIYHQIPGPAVPLIFIGSRPGDMARVAADVIRIFPGSEWRLVFCLLKILVERNQSHVDPQGLAGIRKMLQEISCRELLKNSGAGPSQLEELAMKVVSAKHPLLIFGRSLIQTKNSGVAFSALADMAFFMDGRLRILPAALAANDRGTGNILSRGKGFSYLEMIPALEQGKLKCLILVGEDPLRSLPGRERVRRALEMAESIIVIESFADNLCIELAHACLPLKLSLENSGSFVNAEGHIQEFSPAMENKEARGFREIASAWAEVLGGKIRTEGRIDETEMGRFKPLTMPQSSDSDNEGLILELGTAYPHLYGGDLLTFNSPHLAREFSSGYVELHPDDVASLGIRSGWRARIVSAVGQIEAVVKQNPALLKGTAFMPIHFGGNMLAPYAFDPDLRTPILRGIPIRVEKI